MPRMDGYQLCKTIKGNQATDHIPIVMLTGKDGLMDKVRGRMVGSEDYLTKPFDPNELIRLVEKHISG
jgi:twitching motility two-component system response regulator PilG